MKTALGILAEIYDALLIVIFGRDPNPDDLRMPDVPAWRTKRLEPRKVPQIKSNAKRLEGDANVYEWPDLATVTGADGLTEKDWGAVTETKTTSDARLAAFVKSERARGLTYAQIAVAARQRLDMKVSLSTVEKIGAALSRSEGEGHADSNKNQSAS